MDNKRLDSWCPFDIRLSLVCSRMLHCSPDNQFWPSEDLVPGMINNDSKFDQGSCTEKMVELSLSAR
jgi:hypothetical protein